MKKLKKKDYLLIGTLFIPLIVLIVYLLFKGYIFGSNVDWSNQHITISEYFRKLFYSNGKIIPSFAFNLGMGQNIFNYSYYGLFSPIILLSYLLPFIPMYVYIPMISIIMYFISIIMFYIWIKDKYNRKIAYISSLIFALNATFSYHFHRHLMFVIYMPFMIGALQSIDLYFEKGKKMNIIIYTILLILTNYYFSVSGIFTIGIYTIYKILKTDKMDFTKLKNVVFFVLVAILITGILLFPTTYAIINGRIRTNASIQITFLDLINPIKNYQYTFYNSYYSWGITFIYIIAIINGLLSRKKEQIFLGIITTLFIIFPLFSYILNGFMYIDGKCFIPFLPLSILQISELLNNIFINKLNFKKMLPCILPIGALLIYFALGKNNICLLIIDVVLILISLYLSTNKQINIMLYITIFTISLISFISSSLNESYMKISDIKNINSSTYKELINKINDKNIYRISNKDYILYNPNKIYDISENKTTSYSSLLNKYYISFIRNIFQNEVINKDNTTVTQTSNVLFNIYSGTKYLISSSDAEIGYTEIENIDDIKLYVNENVLPIAYASSNIMSQREFETLEYPYTIDALLNYIIIDKKLDNVYKTNINNYENGYKIEEINNIIYKKENGHYIINTDNNANLKIKLYTKIQNKILIISFNMNKAKDGFACSSDITINDVKNALSCSNWKYNNNNNSFKYVLSSNKSFDTLNIQLSKGSFDIDNIKIYTIDYVKVSSIKDKVDEMVIYKNKIKDNHISGEINIKEDGYLKITIPYDEGFNLYVDGKPVKKLLIDKAFLGLEISKGIHKIDIIYTPPLLKIGIITSIIGILLLIIILIYPKLKTKIKKFSKTNN